MKKQFLVLFLLIFSGIIKTNAQVPNWSWAKASSGNNKEETNGMSVDANGNVYVTGWFVSTIVLGSYALTSNGDSDIFIAKYDGNGNVLWLKSAGGNLHDVAYHIVTDHSGNLYITGIFESSSIIFGIDTLSNFNSGHPNIFLTKYDTNGNVLWAKSAGGNNSDYSFSVTTDPNDNVYITGYFSSPSIIFGSYILANNGGRDIFLVKYDTLGNVLWAKSSSGNSYDESFSVATDVNGNVFITGFFDSDLIHFGQYTLVNTIQFIPDIFVVKYDSTGNVLWAKKAGGSSNDLAYSIATDISGNAYITGSFLSPSITFGANTFVNNGTYDDVFIVKYDANGNVIWAKNAGGNDYDFGFCVTVSSNNIVYVTGGFYSGSITFDSTTIISPLNSNDPMFIASFDSAGSVLCADALASGADDYNNIAADTFGNAFVSGAFRINPFVIGNDSLSLTGTENVFVGKFNCNGTVGISSLPISSTLNGIYIYPNPTTDEFTIYTKQFPADVYIYSVLGKEILSQHITTARTKLQTSSLSSGIYFYEVINKDGVIGKGKVVKE